MRRNPDIIQMMKQLAALVPRVTCELDFLDSVSTEWRLYQADAVKLKQHTISAIRTVKDVINKYKEVEQIPATRDLIRRFCGTHVAYIEYLSMLQRGHSH